MTEKPKYHTVADIARRLRRSPRTVRDWVREGCPVGGRRIPLRAVKAGKSYLVAHEDLEIFELRLSQAATARPDLDD